MVKFSIVIFLICFWCESLYVSKIPERGIGTVNHARCEARKIRGQSEAKKEERKKSSP